MAISVLSLPIPLVLLIHLHILEYPYTNRPEYDHNVFNQRLRGLRDRMKTMEDVCYFLVGKLEAGGNAVKNILSTYPCVQPSDAVAFRTSLTKYLEALRHSSLYPSSKPLASMKGKPGTTALDGKGPVAWWWKDVMVRKSLLEECGGDKFERVLLSLSTHVLLKNLKKTQSISSPDDVIDIIRSQPQIYADLVSKAQSTRHAWSRSVSLLSQRQADLKALRMRLLSQNTSITSKYDSLSTDRLLTLAESKLGDLLNYAWQGDSGRDALEFLIELAGLKLSLSTSGVGFPTKSDASSKKPHSQLQPQPLPIAAAHYPSHIKRLRRPIFQNSSSHNPRKSIAPTAADNISSKLMLGSHVKLALSDQLDAEKRMHQALTDSLTKTRKAVKEVLHKTKALEEKLRKSGKKRSTAIELWAPVDGQALKREFDYESRPTPELLASLSLHVPDDARGVEKRIDKILELLPAYPPIPDLSALPEPSDNDPGRVLDPKPVSLLSSSNIPAPSTRIPRPNGPLDTKTAAPSKLKKGAVHNHSKTPEAAFCEDFRRASTLVGNTKRSNTDKNQKSARKSIRFSIAAVRRQSMFLEDNFDEEVSRIIIATEDTSTEEDPLVVATPRARSKPINRIYTAGTPRPRSTTKKSKQSFPMALVEPSVALPSLASGSSSFSDWMHDESDNDDAWGAPAAGDVGDDGEEYDEAPSMTLRDILLQSETTQFELLDYDQEPDDGLQDESFEWE